jgi:hypothetical protein
LLWRRVEEQELDGAAATSSLDERPSAPHARDVQDDERAFGNAIRPVGDFRMLDRSAVEDEQARAVAFGWRPDRDRSFG